jgi:hypothetical protein
MQRLMDKYLLLSKDLSLVDKKLGNYYVFRTPHGQLYVIDDDSFTNKLIGPSIQKNIRPNMLIPEDTFTVKSTQFSGLLQYKYRVRGEYYIVKDQHKNDQIIIRGADMNGII